MLLQLSRHKCGRRGKSVPNQSHQVPPDDLSLIDHLIFLKWFMSLRNNKLKLNRSYLFNIKLVKRSSRGGKTCEVTLYDHAYYRGNFQARSVKPSQWNPIGTRCYIKFSSQEIVHHRTKDQNDLPTDRPCLGEILKATIWTS